MQLVKTLARVHERTFRLRQYECDAFGHLNNTNYLRFMQETAFDASAAAGYDLNRYAEMGRKWHIRHTEIEYLRPLRYGDSVTVKTWVADFRRASSRRVYEFYLAGSPELVAQAHTDWVFINSETGQPVKVPIEMIEAFFPNGIPPAFPPRQPFPAAPPPPPGVFKTRRRVIWQDLDLEKHVNNAVYLAYLEDCGMQVIAAHGWPVQRMIAAGFAIILRKHQIQYLKPALLDDNLELATWAAGIKRSTATRHYTIRRENTGELLVQVHTLGVWINLATGRPIRIPADFIADFAPNIAPEPAEANSKG